MKAIKLRSRKAVSLFSLFLLFLSFGFILKSCYPGDALSPSDTDVIATFYKDGTDFSSKLTYAMPDSVIHIGSGDEALDEEGPYDRQILNRIEDNLKQIGYEEEENPENADVLVVAAISTSTWVSGGCYPYWGWWYPYPWCVPYSYSWQTGSILISMTESDEQVDTDAIWFTGINGIPENTSANTSVRINNNIDQAFTQSPSLGDGK